MSESFYNDGFWITPHPIFDAQEVERALQEIKQVLPSWSSGFEPPVTITQKTAEQTPVFQIGNLYFEGCALSRRRVVRGAGPKPPHDTPNWLLGRQAMLSSKFWGSQLKALSRSPALLSLAQKFLNGRDVCFIGGKLLHAYQGYTGHDGRFVLPLLNLTEDPWSLWTAGRSLIIVVIFLDDVTSSLSPFTVIPGSQASFPAIHARQAELLGLPGTQNGVIPQRGLYEEVLPQGLQERALITARAGQVLIFHPTTLYREEANLDLSRTRSVLMLHFAKAQQVHLLQRPPRKERRKLFLTPSVLRWKNRFSPIRPFRYVYRRIVRRMIQKMRRGPLHVNIGGGTGWRHPTFLNVDIWYGADVKHNLIENETLPFSTGRVGIIYSSHCLEHLREAEARKFFQEAFRCLHKGGILRITCPDMDLYFDAYERRDLDFFSYHFNRECNRYDSWPRFLVRMFAEPVVDEYSDQELRHLYQKLGREAFMDHFMEKIAALDSQYVAKVLPHQHKSWWTHRKLIQGLLACGFSEAYPCAPNESRAKVMRNARHFDTNNPLRSLRVEAVK